jgi:hypothetical protein
MSENGYATGRGEAERAQVKQDLQRDLRGSILTLIRDSILRRPHERE